MMSSDFENHNGNHDLRYALFPSCYRHYPLYRLGKDAFQFRLPAPMPLQRASTFSSLPLCTAAFLLFMANDISFQNYPWGKIGKNSLSARLCAGTPDTGFEIQDDQPYAEMWMGDYVSGFSPSDPPMAPLHRPLTSPSQCFRPRT